MRQLVETLVITTHGKHLYDISDRVAAVVRSASISTGLLTVFCRHTSASLLIQENADPAVHVDIGQFFDRLVPENANYEHSAEGSDDMPAHIRSALTQSHLSIPIVHGVPVFGAWQGVYLFEHRKRPHRREVVLHVFGV
jgi:secondary thiamine-phosphate synthase enzyme